MTKIDIALSVYGKPYHTAVAMFSLLEHCNDYIDKVYFQEEIQHPHGDNINFIIPWFQRKLGNRFIHYKPPLWLDWHGEAWRVPDEKYRMSIRYQYSWESTDKDYLFIFHNDCLFTGDIIGGMLEKLEDQTFTGVGLCGQCWNCCAATAGVCGHGRHEKYHPTYEEAVKLVASVPSPRTHVKDISREHPMPFPECRLNELACLINIAKIKHLVVPKGVVPPFGLMGHDIGTDWYRELILRGYRFTNWFERLKHDWIITGGGHTLDECPDDHYYEIENKAKEYLEEHYKEEIL